MPTRHIPADFPRAFAPPRSAALRDRGFTLIEVMAVIAIIALLLAVGLPAFNKMQQQAAQNRLELELATLVQRARTLAIADRTPTAIRFCPAEWEQIDQSAGDVGLKTARAGQQVAVLYQYRFSAFDLSVTTELRFDERFERVAGLDPVVLPEGTWAAPAEATLLPAEGFDSTALLSGNAVEWFMTRTLADFPVDAAASTTLLHADDFLIVFDPTRGLAPARWDPNPPSNPPGDSRRSAWRMSAIKYNPDPNPPINQQSFETAYQRATFNAPPDWNAPFRRFNFTGIVLYERERFLDPDGDGTINTVGNAGVAANRRTYLRENGRVLWIERNSGRLLAAREDS